MICSARTPPSASIPSLPYARANLISATISSNTEYAARRSVVWVARISSRGRLMHLSDRRVRERERFYSLGCRCPRPAGAEWRRR